MGHPRQGTESEVTGCVTPSAICNRHSAHWGWWERVLGRDWGREGHLRQGQGLGNKSGVCEGNWVWRCVGGGDRWALEACRAWGAGHRGGGVGMKGKGGDRSQTHKVCR